MELSDLAARSVYEDNHVALGIIMSPREYQRTLTFETRCNDAGVSIKCVSISENQVYTV